MLMLFYKFIVGVLFPIFSGLLMFGTFKLMNKVKPRPIDPKHMRIQQSVVIGGLTAVLLAVLISKEIAPKELLYAGGSMGLLALISIAIDQGRIARAKKSAEHALRNSKKAIVLISEGEDKTGEEMLQEALLTTELAHGSYHHQVATIVLFLADHMRKTARSEAAGILYKRAVGIYSVLAEPSTEFVQALIAYSEHLRNKEDIEASYAMAARGVTESKKLENREDLTGRCYMLVSLAQGAKDKLQEAYGSSQLATKLLTKSLGSDDKITLQARGLTANHCVRLGRVAEAERMLLEVISAKQNLGQDEDASFLNPLLDLGIVLKAKKGSSQDAYDQNMLRAINLFRSAVGPSYERAEELFEILPTYLSQKAPPAMAQFYTHLFKKENSAARRVLERNEEIATVEDYSGWIALQWASFFDASDIAASLISRGANVEHGARSNLPAYFIAARWGCRGVLTMLGRRDCDFEIETGDGSRPIHAAVRSGDQLTFDTIVTKRVQLDLPNHRGWTPLHEAAYYGERKFLLTLISKGLDVDIQAPERKESPLHAAVLGGDKATVDMLILNMANPNAPDSQYVTPLGLAERLGHTEIFSALKAHADSQRKEAHEEAAAEAKAKATEQIAEREAAGKEEG